MKSLSSNIIFSEKSNKEISFSEIQSIYGKAKILTDYPIYLMDESKLSGTADWLFFPKSEAEIISILNFSRENEIRTYISAARTGIVGACVPFSGCILSTEKMNKIIGIGLDRSRGNYFIRVEPGVILSEINDRLMKKKFENAIELTPGAKIKFKESNKEFHYPIDPTEMSATIGGTVATNASGARTLKYGPTRDWIKGLRVILSSGDILNIQRGKYFASNEGKFIINKPDGEKLQFKIPNYIFNTNVKNAAGIYSKPNMDLIDLFIGSEGILGIITQIDIWITEKHPLIYNILFFNTEKDAISFGEILRKTKILSTEFIEFFSDEALKLLKTIQNEEPSSIGIPQIPISAKSALFFDMAYDEDNLEEIYNELNKIAEKCKTNLSDGWSGYENQDFARFKRFRHAVPEYINTIIAHRKQRYPELHKLGTDMSVPEKYLKEMMKFYHTELNNANLEYVIFGHLGDNHMHVNILPKTMEELKLGEIIYGKFAEKAVEYGGSISGEHGIGKIKREYLKIMYSQKELDEMRLIKKTLDPSLVLNYGNIVNFKAEEE